LRSLAIPNLKCRRVVELDHSCQQADLRTCCPVPIRRGGWRARDSARKILSFEASVPSDAMIRWPVRPVAANSARRQSYGVAKLSLDRLRMDCVCRGRRRSHQQVVSLPVAVSGHYSADLLVTLRHLLVLGFLTVTLYSPGNRDFLPLVCVPTILNVFVDGGSGK